MGKRYMRGSRRAGRGRGVWGTLLLVLAMAVGVAACDQEPTGPEPRDFASAPRAMIDRFSADAATLFVRTADNGLPGPNEPVDFDRAPFLTHGFGPGGELTAYYDFDVQSTTPAPIWVFFRESSGQPVAGQLNVVDVIPGEAGYNDFWQVVRVFVGDDYVANTVTSRQGIVAAGFRTEVTNALVNCPVVPEGSTAALSLDGGPQQLEQGWYRDQAIFYFAFTEAPLAATGAGEVPRSPIFVSFNVNPGQDGGGPPSGFMTETGTEQTHNVLATLPGDAGYSPLWHVRIYDNAEFLDVRDLASAQASTVLVDGAAHVNCPVVMIGEAPGNPMTADRAVVDRFSGDAGTLFVRDDANGLPGPGEAIDFDEAPFITQGFGPAGEVVRYYDFDVQPTVPAPIYVLFREGQDQPVAGQLNIVDVIPGDEGYNDFWQVVRVTVPSDYVANTVTSLQQITDAGYALQPTPNIVNCPIVPEGSTAALRLNEGEGNGLIRGWYQGQLVFYFNFAERALQTRADGEVPRSPIFVSFNINPGMPGGGPPSGFMTEPGTVQTHNVLATLPADEAYSPLWHVRIYDNADFAGVADLASAQAATLLVDGAAHVNCPVVDIQ